MEAETGQFRPPASCKGGIQKLPRNERVAGGKTKLTLADMCKGSKKSNSSRRLNKENVHLSLSGAGDLATVDSSNAEALDGFFASGFSISLSGLCA